MKGVKHGTRDEGRLVVNPEFFDSLVCVGYDDSLVSHSTKSDLVVEGTVPDLKDGTIFLGPLLAHSCMITPKL